VFHHRYKSAFINYVNQKTIKNKILTDTKAAVFLETALVMPLFMILFCFCIDLPRIIVIKQRTYGVQRVLAEIRARNSGSFNYDASFLSSLFFDDNLSANVKISINNYEDKKTLLSEIVDIQDWLKNDIWKYFTGILKFLGNIVTGGNLKPYLFNVFSNDKLYHGSVTVNAQTILPPQAYNDLANLNAPNVIIKTEHDCYIPSFDSCKYTGESFIGKLIDWLHKL